MVRVKKDIKLLVSINLWSIPKKDNTRFQIFHPCFFFLIDHRRMAVNVFSKRVVAYFVFWYLLVWGIFWESLSVNFGIE